MRVSIRRTTRVDERSGDPLEDLGVVPDEIHHLTRNDLLEGDEDLIEHAASILHDLPVRTLVTKATSSTDPASALVSVTTQNISRLDVYLDSRPQMSLDVEDGSTTFDLPLGSSGSHNLELRGYDRTGLAAVRRTKL
jgi:hypothetical protein